MTTFTRLGYGTPGKILARLPANTQTIIRDDAAATAGQTDCWFASEAAWQDAQTVYCDDGFEGAVYTVADLTDAARSG